MMPIKQGEPSFRYCNTIDSGHLGNVFLIVNINQSLLATSSYDKTIIIWNATTFTQKYILQGHKHPIYCLIKLTESQIASGSYDNTIKVWDINEKQCTLSIKVNSVAYCLLYQGDNILFTGLNQWIYVFNIETGECLTGINVVNHNITCLESISDELIAFGGNDFEIKCYDHRRQLIKFSLVRHFNTVITLKKLGEDKLISSSDDRTIKIWNVVKGSCITTLTGHKQSVWSFKIFKDRYIFSVGWDGTIRLWDMTTYQCISIVSSLENSPIYTIEFIQERQIAVGLKNAKIILWDF